MNYGVSVVYADTKEESSYMQHNLHRHLHYYKELC